MRRLLLLLTFVSSLFFYSCESEEDKQQEKLRLEINSAWRLIDKATDSPEVEMRTPLGFTLGTTSKEFKNRFDQLVKQNGGKTDSRVVNTTEFGGVNREIRVHESYYFSDPNTQTDTICKITFLFDEFRTEYDINVLKAFLSQIDSMFDSTWETAEFQLELDSTQFDNYHKFWVKNNQVVELEYAFYFPMLSYYNIPKSGTEWLKESVNMTLEIHEEVSKKDFSEEKPKVYNSEWDASVSQVEDYLEDNLKDWDSYESMEWSEVSTVGTKFKVRHKYRAKNSFGGYGIANQIFTLDSDGNVIEVVDWD